MSPIRRFWVAWFGGKLMPFALFFHFLIAFLFFLMQTDSKFQPTGKDHEISILLLGYFSLLPCFLGLRFQILVCTESLVFSQLHVRWIIKSFFIHIFPAMVLSILGTLLLSGYPFWWSCGFAFVTTTFGFWLGYTRFLSSIFWFIIFGILILYLNDALLPETMPVMVGILAVVFSCIGVCFAWKRIEHRHCQEPKQSVNLLSSMWESIDRLFPATSTPKTQTGRFPSFWTPIRLGFRHLPKHGILVFPLVVTFFTLMPLMGYPQITTILSYYVVWFAPWFGLFPVLGMSNGGNGKGLSFALAGHFANERLRPWSRQQSSVASFLSVFSQGLVVPITLIGGIVCGLILSACISGNYSIALQSWWFLPLAVMVTSCGVALAIIGMSFHRWGALLGCGIIGVLQPKMLLFLNQNLPDLLIFLAIIFLLTLILVPLAWYRLARAELP